MHEFLITVSCVFHLNCMIPGGVIIIRQFPDMVDCEHQAKAFIAQIGGAPKDYHISCKQRN